MSDLPRIFLTRELPPATMKRLRESSQLTMSHEDRSLSKQELLEGLQDVDGLLCQLTDTIDDEVLASNPNLKVVSNYAVGFNNIDVAAATKRNIAVTNTPGVLSDSTADMAWALMFAVARRVVEGDRFVRGGNWQGWAPLQYLGLDISGSTLGLVGLGRIGRAMIQRAKGFDMRVLYWNRTRMEAEEERKLGVEYVELDDLLAQSDFVSLHVALAEGTKHLIDERRLEQMKSTAYLINTARGPVVDEKALVRALQANTIAGAGLDVFENEPQLEPELFELPNTVLAPHLGSATIATRSKMGELAVENCLAGCLGKRPPNLVNPDYDRQ
ncbi:D-isomer specific 2-hydroxyacid dehydrogenase domain protein [Rhodopirellula maiorica SM1]|uniref:D-isomer specific 2-hydroxyacid dehydrogenase domain protein n=1 Tax=Rhodopirellula maiorica SM1 TaxID=1265738 RepID=M5RRK7_9BACT|nr:D-glycerate dehydrogenase [Rhodopirellula maiorica]EMI18022.1 D-isomer specific 2-hydroxyacid dehydrogenase domain protein [Rhodopirellula maiorica SM1]